MLCRPAPLRTTTTRFLRPISTPAKPRHLHHRVVAPPPPSPTPFVPDVATFLTLIGRKLSAHASKIGTWSALFNLTSPQLKELGIEEARQRRYLLQCRQRFRNGQWGIGGDLKHVKDGVARLRVCDVPVADGPGRLLDIPATMTKAAGHRRMVLNLPGDGLEEVNPDGEKLAKSVEGGVVGTVSGVSLKGSTQIRGKWVQTVKGSKGREAIIKVDEGLWEIKRGHKVDGGERRKAQVRQKKRSAERKAARV